MGHSSRCAGKAQRNTKTVKLKKTQSSFHKGRDGPGLPPKATPPGGAGAEAYCLSGRGTSLTVLSLFLPLSFAKPPSHPLAFPCLLDFLETKLKFFHLGRSVRRSSWERFLFWVAIDPRRERSYQVFPYFLLRSPIIVFILYITLELVHRIICCIYAN